MSAGFGVRPVTYHSVTLSFPRAIVQFAFLLRLLRSKPLPLQRTADYHAFGAAVGSALQQAGIKSPESFIAGVSRTVDAWPTWPDAYLIDRIDIEFLYDSKTRPQRLRALNRLPDHLRHNGPYARTALQERDEYAAERGLRPESLGRAWPDEEPKF